MIGRVLMLAAGLSLSLAAPPAGAGPVTVVNQTGQPVCQVFLSPAGAGRWVGQAWGAPCLSQGQRRNVTPEPVATPDSTSDRRDLMVIFESGSERIYFGLDLQVFTHLVLRTTEAEIFEWDPDSAAGFSFKRPAP